MSPVKEKIYGVVELMDEQQAEQFWALIRTHFLVTETSAQHKSLMLFRHWFCLPVTTMGYSFLVFVLFCHIFLQIIPICQNYYISCIIDHCSY